MFTNNCRDEVTLIFLKHKFRENVAVENISWIADTTKQLAWVENQAIRKTFAEVRDRNAKNLQAGSYEAIAEQCDEFFKSIAAETAQVG